jgi:cytochrome oxidase Cu insertion factor (SCO1/SenC/PrrC family)
MIGVTATNNQDPTLKDCMKEFKIYASKLEFEEDDAQKGRKSYTIDHTILTYLMSDTNEYLAHLGANLGEHDLSSLIL